MIMTDVFSNDEKQVIIQNLDRFPHVNQIINKNTNFFRKYNASKYDHIPESERDDRLEFTLASILKNIDMSSFYQRIQNLDRMVSSMPQTSKTKFGRKLSQLDFFSIFSEIEVYHHLLLHRKKPDLEPRISTNGNSVDFGFFLRGKYFYVEVKTPRLSNPINDYFNSLPSHDSDPELHIGVGFIDQENQRFVDVTNTNSNLDINFRNYPRESARVEHLIFNDFIGGNLRTIDNPFSLPIILIINYEFARSSITFYYGVLEWLDCMMRECPPDKIQGLLIYPPPMPLDTNSYFFRNPNYDFSKEEIQFFSSLMTHHH
ncbi:MAG: hypothetical protein ACYDDV_00170 [Methanoregula sp.]